MDEGLQYSSLVASDQASPVSQIPSATASLVATSRTWNHCEMPSACVTTIRVFHSNVFQLPRFNSQYLLVLLVASAAVVLRLIFLLATKPDNITNMAIG
eukprot:6179123-Pleurochrysis_carterae.AAC.2